MSDFKWNPRREKTALLLAQGYTVIEVSQEIGVTERTIYRWKNDLDFAMEVDRLSLMVGVSNKAERLRIAMQVIRGKIEDGLPKSDKDMLDWLKFVLSETDGAKLNLAAIFETLEKSSTDND